jgi:DinB superfamily
MSERIERIKADLASARQHLEHILDAVGDRWDTQVYSDGAGWTVKQLAVHLSDADRGTNGQIMGIAAGREVIPADFDLNRYNKRAVEKRIEMSVEDVRKSLDTTRAELLTWLDTIDDATLNKKGRHATLQILSITEILDVMVAHERGHANDIADVLGLSR